MQKNQGAIFCSTYANIVFPEPATDGPSTLTIAHSIGRVSIRLVAGATYGLHNTRVVQTVSDLSSL